MNSLSVFIKRGCGYAVRRYHGVRRYLHLYDAEERRVLSYRNRYHDERCAVIGNGPSLTIQDLESLQSAGFVCFASNKIYKAYPLTDWRPDYYACIDWPLFDQNKQELLDAIVCPAFLRRDFQKDVNTIAGKEGRAFDLVHYMTYGWRHIGKTVFYPQAANILSGGTVTYTLLELAWMMGFREIYLIGCDHYYASFAGKTPHSRIIATDATNRDYAIPDYVSPGEEINVGDVREINYSYRMAREYAEKHGGHIYNATRGGHLDVFQRVDLDSVLKDSKGKGKII